MKSTEEDELFRTVDDIYRRKSITSVVSDSFKKYRRKMRKPYDRGLFVVCTFFGMGSWLLVNGIFSQMPSLVQTAPEKWELPSYFSLLVQLANISPLIYSLVKNKTRYLVNDSTLILTFMTIGTVSMFLLAFTYDKVVVIFGRRRSFYMFVLSFFISIVGCTSSVLFIPFMNTLPEQYLIPYFIGEGVSGFLPSIIALVQGVSSSTNTNSSSCVNATTSSNLRNENNDRFERLPLFDSNIFFLILTLFMTSSTVSFLYLSTNPRYKLIELQNNTRSTITEQQQQQSSSNNDNKERIPLASLMTISYGCCLYGALLTVQLLVNVLGNGILPSVESYSCLPYGNDAYHWAINIGQMISPVTFYAAMFLPLTSVPFLTGSIIVCTVCLFYQITTAFLSPYPPLVGTTLGVFLVVFVWVCSNATIAYVKLSIATIFRKSNQVQALFYYGVVTQTGSAIGSFLSFYVINYTHLLKSVDSQRC